MKHLLTVLPTALLGLCIANPVFAWHREEYSEDGTLVLYKTSGCDVNNWEPSGMKREQIDYWPNGKLKSEDASGCPDGFILNKGKLLPILYPTYPDLEGQWLASVNVEIDSNPIDIVPLVK